ncbi:hybrid sensor histidine kinase/response regulator [Gymnodinialimonas ceratoperidinii]|uniref:histidine kinase n=1 Tax=Gymnodinialimonas ceratoperidinii TaxID=2856823 RepID=A0A8F6YE34_9RHOB|nr:PAS domain S-box protein [Gymnodinialimonas ceratoperidinii]QXT41170.1 PAS domain S-box protein [Gymnodinialimonas ceratoperidinii]
MTSDQLGRIVEDAVSEVYVFSVDDFRFSLVNKGARDNLGFSMEELREMTPWDIKVEFSKEEFIALAEPLLKGERTEREFETVHQRKDGSRYDVWVHLQLISADGKRVFYTAIQDITKQKATAAALTKASSRLDAILSNTTMSIFMMDERQQCVFMNKAAEALTGYTFAETQGRPLHDVIHHTHPDGRPFPIEECEIDRAFPEGHQVQGEETFVHKDGSFYPVGFTASPMEDETGKTVGTVIEVREISDELRARNAEKEFSNALKARVDEAMAERDRLEARLVQSQKVEAMGQLTGGVAHDFNNLLQVIGSNLQLLLKEMPGDDPKRRFAENAIIGVSRGANLTAQLLAFSRQQPLEPKPKNVGRLLYGMDDMLRRTLGEAIEIETIIEGGLWNCLVDPSQMETVILNLAINARDAMSHHGKLTIEAANATFDESYAEQDPRVVPGQYVMLSITDTGSGISPDIIERVFDPFFTTKEPGEGTGLGLSMVYGFIQQSGGHVKIASEEGDGTTVRVYLPKTDREEEVEQSSSEGEAPKGNGEIVLVVEDEDAVRQTAVDQLRDLGYSVLTAENADNALAIVNSGVKIDVLFTDVVMPGNLRSPELAKLAKERLPDIGVLFTSGYTQNEIIRAGRLEGGVELLSKPYSRERLSRKIHEVLERRAAKMPPGSTEETADAAKGANGAAGKLRVLLLEDDFLIRMATADMLSDLGYEALEAGTIAEASDLLSREPVQVLLTDLGLPDGDGMDLVHRVLESHPEISVIIASGSDLNERLEDSGLQGSLTCLTKPYDQRALEQAFAQRLGRA